LLIKRSSKEGSQNGSVTMPAIHAENSHFSFALSPSYTPPILLGADVSTGRWMASVVLAAIRESWIRFSRLGLVGDASQNAPATISESSRGSVEQLHPDLNLIAVPESRSRKNLSRMNRL
jgi:hypothetical protein